MKRLRFLFVVLALVMAVSVISGVGMAAARLKVGITYQNLQNEFILGIQDAARAKAKALGIDLIEADGQGNAESQITQVENFISQKVNAIVLNPFDKDGCAVAVVKANAAKIPIIVVNAQVSNLDKALAYVGSDDFEAGQIEMQFLATQLKGTGNLVIIHGPNGHSAEVARTQGNKQILAKNPNMKVLFEQTANWDRAQAMALMENWLQSGKKIDAVCAQNDEMALGAYKAIEAAHKEKDILVVGIDAIADGLKAVGDGKLAATVFQDSKGQGALAVDLAVKAIKHQKVAHINYIPFQLVTKSNLAKFKK
jgi:inositol transport system substrate-binding protein